LHGRDGLRALFGNAGALTVALTNEEQWLVIASGAKQSHVLAERDCFVTSFLAMT
jgi:hypothetical protein